MGYERNDRRYERDPSYGYRPQGQYQDRERGYGRGDYRGTDRDRDDRGFFDRAGDEVRSWFGDEEAERRRRWDEREDQRDQERGYGREPQGREFQGRASQARDQGYSAYGAPSGAGYGRSFGGDDTRATRDRQDHDPHYRSWRDRQMAEYDRDYDDYRRERQSSFDTDFGTWRTTRQGQRGQLANVREHQEVVGSDGQHVGTVDKVRGDRVILTKKDQDAGGHHHSIPSSWITKVGEKVEISKTADQAHQHWKDEERNSAFSGGTGRDSDGPHALNRSFSGTY